MRKQEKEIHDKGELEAILKKGRICRLGLSDGNVPYIVPMNYGYSEGVLYFHCAKEGRKIDMIRKNDRVCFKIETDTEIVESEMACKWDMKFKSIIGYGTIEEINDPSGKTAGLSFLMNQYSELKSWSFPQAILEKALVLKLTIASMTGKKSSE